VIKLFGMHGPNVRKVGILLEELELDYELQHVAVFQGEQFLPDFLALNPMAKVPVLIDAARGEGKPIIESGAILFYLAETYGAFLPADGMSERPAVSAWPSVLMRLSHKSLTDFLDVVIKAPGLISVQ
jgi:GST-like protein